MKTRRHVFMFKPRFAPLVEIGAKTSTIRPPRKRKVNVGDIIDAREWTGKPYRSKQRKLCDIICRQVEPIKLSLFRGRYHCRVGKGKNSFLMRYAEIREIAKCEGFEGGLEMFEWFEQVHGLPFVGTWYCWEPGL